MSGDGLDGGPPIQGLPCVVEPQHLCEKVYAGYVGHAGPKSHGPASRGMGIVKA